jgi:hypothetical protein
MASSLCSRCGAPIRWRRKVSESGRVTNRPVTLLGNPHSCPRSNAVAILLDKGKRPYKELAKRRAVNSANRVARNTAKGLTINEDEQ